MDRTLDGAPSGDAIGVPVKLDRKEAVLRGRRAESPAEARIRISLLPDLAQQRVRF